MHPDPHKPEFDAYAERYEELLKDPVRDWFTGRTDFFYWRKWLLLREHCQKRFGDLGSLRWLDVGCGRGELLSLGASSVRRAAGCDPSAGMLRQAKGLEFVQQVSPLALPFREGEFDLVTAVCVYHHVPHADRPALTVEARRVLRPGGIFCIIEHNPLNPVTQLIVRRAPVDRDAHLLYLGEARRLLREAGFDPAGRQYFLLFPGSVYGVLRGVESALRALPFGGQYAVMGAKP